MSTVRIVFLGTPDFAKYHLDQLLHDDHFQVVGVVSQPDRPSGRNMQLKASPVKELALEKKLPVICPESIKDENVLQQIADWKAEAAVVVAYGQIVPQKFLDLFPGKVVNVHGSLLPLWRGAAPIQRSIEAGDKETGVSLQVMVKKLDAGDVIGFYRLPIGASDANELMEQMKPLGAKLLHIDFMDYLRGQITPKPQDESKVTYAHKIEKNEAKVDWSKSAGDVVNHMRAMVMGPGSVCLLQDKNLKIHKAKVCAGKGQPGEVIAVNADSFVVACGSGQTPTALEITEVQPESRPRMPVKDFLLGYPLKKGDKLK